MNGIIIYASLTGNTEMISRKLSDKLEIDAVSVNEATVELLKNKDVVLLGSPAMGSEELDDDMREFFLKAEESLKGKNVYLFGSYDWGDGEWLRSWTLEASNNGINVKGSLAVHLDEINEDILNDFMAKIK